MKIIKYSLGILTGLLLIISCNNDVMDTKPFAQFDDATVWGSKESADAFVFSTYSSALGSFVGHAPTNFPINFNSDNNTPNGIHSNLWNGDYLAKDILLKTWGFLPFGNFGTLRKCNIIIEKAKTSETLTEDEKKELIGEGHFLRALTYFDLARKQGRFIPVQKVLTLQDSVLFKTPLTKSPKESYQILMKDIDVAIQNLPEESRAGRVNKYVALAFKSRMALQAYAYTKDMKYVDMAIDAGNKVVNSGKYSLDSNYGGIFLKEGRNSPEIILAQYRVSKNTTVGGIPEMQYSIPNIKPDDLVITEGTPILRNSDGPSFECWAINFPTQNLVDQYLVVDEADGKAKLWYETSQYLNNVKEEDPTSLKEGDFTKKDYKWATPSKDDMGSTSKGNKIVRYGRVINDKKINEIMYNGRDKRMDATIVRDSVKWLKDELVTLCIQGNLWAGARDGRQDSWYTTCTNYYWRKGVYDIPSRAYYGNPIDYHYVVIRLGEVYMNLAEAYLVKGNVSDAVQALNKTRVAHGQIPASTASSEKEAWEDYIRERRVEMAFEADLYWSFLRWGKYGGFANNGKAPGDVIDALEEAPLKIQITKDRKRFFIGQVTRHDAYDRKFTTKRYLIPIPQGQIDKRAAYGINDTQNPGW